MNLRRVFTNSLITVLSACSFACSGADGAFDTSGEGPEGAQQAPAGDGPGGAAEAAIDDGLPSEALVASVALSPTHVVRFYDLGDGHGVVTEALDIDRDSGSVLPQDKSSLAALYLELAGDGAEVEALARLEAIDAARATVVDGEAAAPGAGPELMSSEGATADFVEKSFSSDFNWFATEICGGCVGWEGNAVSGFSSFRVCTDNPRMCLPSSVGYFKVSRSSASINTAVFNMSSSLNATNRITLDDPCQHDSWWSRTFSVCKKGALVVNQTIGPRKMLTFFDAASKSWKRTIEVVGSSAGIGVGVDY